MRGMESSPPNASNRRALPAALRAAARARPLIYVLTVMSRGTTEPRNETKKLPDKASDTMNVIAIAGQKVVVVVVKSYC